MFRRARLLVWPNLSPRLSEHGQIRRLTTTIWSEHIQVRDARHDASSFNDSILEFLAHKHSSKVSLPCDCKFHHIIGSVNTYSTLHAQKTSTATASAQADKSLHRAFIALGSNVGDRLRYIEDACQFLNDQDGIKIRRTSGLWETEAMYVTDQDLFLNGACEIETTLEPLPLLDRLQSIEKMLGRQKTVDKGPRTIDLDILLYDEEILDEDRLTVPHKLMLERAFVLQPLCELVPHMKHPTPGESIPFSKHLERLQVGKRHLGSTWTPLSYTAAPFQPMKPNRKTQVMAILNITPDSFSDGGALVSRSHSTLRTRIRSYLAAGATVFDVGGQSTRPHAPEVSEAEELDRVLPAIHSIRSVLQEEDAQASVIISIDTYRAPVARAAVEAGATVVNDISAGTLDPDMLPTAAQLGCSVILMHMRGDPSTMMQRENTCYRSGLIDTIGAELMARVQAAEAAGVRRWRIILDPGIGFAKTTGQNLELLRRFHEMRTYSNTDGRLCGFPWVVGASRKGFIGKVTGVEEPRERAWGTAAAVTAAVQGGADMVRVHDVEAMSQVTRMADAIWRVQP